MYYRYIDVDISSSLAFTWKFLFSLINNLSSCQ